MSAPVAVLHVCDKFGVRGSSIHGVSRLFGWWFPRYDRQRFDVSLCGLKRVEPASQKLIDAGLRVRHLGRGRFDPRILGDLITLGRSLRARILHVHGYAAADYGRLAARRLGAGLVLHEHFADPHMPFYQGWADRALRGLTHRAIAVSESTREFLVRERFVPEKRVRVIWNGAPLDEFAPAAAETVQSLRHELGLGDALVVGSVGRLSAQKGHRHLLDAFASVVAAHPGMRLLLVGDGDEEPRLRQQARDLGLAHQVVFAGHRADIPAILGVIDVLAIASLYEGTPLTLFEAMAARKAIVSTAVDGCREVLEDGVTALLVPPADAAALAAALVRAAGDPDLRRGLALAAHSASRQYDIRTCVGKMEALYDEVLSELETTW